jgi:hypothetical protein
LDYLEEQVADVESSNLALQPAGLPNHPSWVIGHLTFSFQLLGGVIGLKEWLPSDWAVRFGPGSAPVADRDRYEPKTEALKILRDAHSRIALAVAALDRPTLDQPFPVESYREIFPTVRHALTQVLAGHTAYHVGQIGVWRRAMGLPPMRRSFE